MRRGGCRPGGHFAPVAGPRLVASTRRLAGTRRLGVGPGNLRPTLLAARRRVVRHARTRLPQRLRATVPDGPLFASVLRRARRGGQRHRQHCLLRRRPTVRHGRSGQPGSHAPHPRPDLRPGGAAWSAGALRRAGHRRLRYLGGDLRWPVTRMGSAHRALDDPGQPRVRVGNGVLLRAPAGTRPSVDPRFAGVCADPARRRGAGRRLPRHPTAARAGSVLPGL